MKTSALLFAFVVAAGPAAAQTPADSSAAPQAPQTSTSQRAASEQPAPRPPEGKRRGSMVGYIEDSTVSSHFRVRFDAAFDGKSPDRAEFFYAKCGCYRGLATADPPAFDPHAPGPAPAVVTGYDYRQAYLEGQYGVGNHFAVFVELPFRWFEPNSFLAGTGTVPSTSGLSDIRAGVKLALISTADRVVTVLVRGEFPSGDAAKGLGTDHGAIVPALLYLQRAGDRFAIESQFGDWHPTGGSAGVPTSGSDKFAGDVLFWGIGPSFEVVSTSRVRFAPVVELVGWHVLGGFQTQIPGTAAGVAVPADGINIVNLKVGARTTIHDASSFYVGYGHKLTNVGWYDDVFRLEYRIGF
ncbi:MAG TPA: hypothetical protein VFX12_08195 [Vicinamibacterales bacterium]|nr:hypothetical protein [Vicinamibacterales bacterium]